MELKINNINEFAKNKNINKIIYESMCYNKKRKLKFYIYYVMKLEEEKKDLIWRFLNEPLESDEYIYSSLMLNKYRRN